MENFLKKWDIPKRLQKFLDGLTAIKGILPLSGLLLVIISLIAHFIPLLNFLTVGEWLLHVGIIVCVAGLLIGDVL